MSRRQLIAAKAGGRPFLPSSAPPPIRRPARKPAQVEAPASHDCGTLHTVGPQESGHPARLSSSPTLVDAVPGGNRWLHEMKYDGYRLEVVVGGGRARAFTRSGLDWSEKFSGVVEAAACLKVDSAVLDGEAFDADGRSSFQTLQGALKGEPGRIVYVAFDLLALNGEDLASRPLLERKALLRDLLPKRPGRIRYSDHVRGNGEKLLDSFCANGLEGVVSKPADSRYAGARSAAWVKTKCIQRQNSSWDGFLQTSRAPSPPSHALLHLATCRGTCRVWRR